MIVLSFPGKTTMYEGEQPQPHKKKSVQNPCKINKKIKIKYFKNLNEVVEHPRKIHVSRKFFEPNSKLQFC